MWYVLLFVAAILSFGYYFGSNVKRKQSVGQLIKAEKQNLNELLAASDSKLIAIRKLRSAYQLDTMAAIEVYVKMGKKSNEM